MRALGVIVMLGLVAAAASGCGRNAEVPFTLQFPTEAHFLASTAASVTVYDAEQDVEICRKLIAGERPAFEPIVRTDQVDVCQFRDGTQSFPDLEQGPRAFFVEVTGMGEAPILRGCRVVALQTSTTGVVIDLSVTGNYDANRRMTNCPNAADRCAGLCN